MILSVEIAFLFTSFKRLRLDREHIRQILLDLEQLTSDRETHIRKAVFRVCGTRFSGREAVLQAMKS